MTKGDEHEFLKLVLLLDNLDCGLKLLERVLIVAKD